MKRAVLLYNAEAGKGKIEKNIDHIVDIFREADYDMQPLPIRFGTNPFDWCGYEEGEDSVLSPDTDWYGRGYRYRL